MKTTLIRKARIRTMDAEQRDHACADLLIHGQTIVAIGPDLDRLHPHVDRVIEAKGMLAMPGLINAHVHSPANFMRGTLEGLPLELFMLYEVPPLTERPPSQRMAYIRTMLGAMEMLKLGITSVMDDAFFVPAPTREGIDGVMEAYRDSGIRATVTLDQPNIVEYDKYPFLADLLPPPLRERMAAAPIASAEELLNHYAYLLERWHGDAQGRLRAAVSCSAPQRVTVPYFEALSALSKQHDLPFVVHILETKLQRVLGEEKFGKSLVRYVHDLGLLDERMQIVHAIWVDEQDMALIAASGATVAHNPVCNLKLGSGIMPFQRLKAHGIPICLGTDEAVADDSHNLWGAIKMAGLIHKITDPEYQNWPSAATILDCAFSGGARALRQSGQIGQLTVGAQADIILLDLESLAFTPLNDLNRQLVYSENGSSVHLTMVAGEVVMQDRRLLHVDEAAIKAEARAMMRDYAEAFAMAENAARELDPFYRAMYLKAAARDVGMNRWAHQPE